MNDLSKGIRLENSDTVLEWGKPVDTLIKNVNGKKEVRGDRTIYHWGKHSILNGLELNLTNSFWNFGDEKNNRNLNSIEYWAIGDEQSKNKFDLISKHLISQFGNPTDKNETEFPEKLWTWRLKEIIIKINFFEQHAYKLCMTIEKE